MLYYNRGYYDNYFIFQAFKFKLSLVSFLLFLCILAVSVAYSNYFFVLYCINFFLFLLYLLINNNEVYTKGDKI